MTETRIYVDSNVYIDIFENRSDKLVPWSEFALEVIRRTLDCEFRIVVSPIIISELKNNGWEKQFLELTSQLEDKNKLNFVDIDSNVKDQAKKLSKSHMADRLHYLLAVKAKANFFITRNWRDFYGLGDIEVLLPEYL